MSNTRLLVAALVLAGLGGAIWYSNKQEAAKQELGDPKAPPKVLKFKEADLTRLEIERRGEPATVLEKNEAAPWQITAPQALNADQQAVTAITAGASDLASKRVVADSNTDLASYGLEPAAVSVTFSMKDGSKKHLRLGESTPDDGAVYAMVDGDPKLYTLDSYNKQTYDKRLADLRDKHLLQFLPDQLERMELAVPGKPVLEFSKVAQGKWQITKPRALRADQLAADALVEALKNAAMDTEGVDVSGKDASAEKAFPSAKPVATARVIAGGVTETLELRQAGGNFYAKSSSTSGIYKVAATLGEALNKTLADFQDKKLFDFGFDDVKKWSFRLRDDTTPFEKSDTKWLSNGREMDSVAVQNAIDKLRDLAASRTDDVAVGPAEIELTVVSMPKGKDGKSGPDRTEVVRLSPSGNDYIGKRGDEPTLYRIDGGTVASMLQALRDVHEAPDANKGKAKAAK